MYLQIEKKSIDKNINLNGKEKWKLVFIRKCHWGKHQLIKIDKKSKRCIKTLRKKSIDKNLNLNQKEKWKLVFICILWLRKTSVDKYLNQIKKEKVYLEKSIDTNFNLNRE